MWANSRWMFFISSKLWQYQQRKIHVVINWNHSLTQKGNHTIWGPYKFLHPSVLGSGAEQVRIIINHKQMASEAKVKFSHWSREKGGSMKRGVFLLRSLWEKRGLRTCWHPTTHWKGADSGGGAGGGGGGHFFILFSPLPLTPYCLAALNSAPSVSREVVEECVYIFVCVESVGGSYWSRTEWNLSHCLPSCSPPPRCLTPRLPPPFSRDKECPECLASPAVSNN